ncbi:ABC transporter permease [Bacteroides graminisolvens]|uniref:ABC-type multidrug transport system, permease component n=1 Tax=Bacteroides graminisolvens DSM 19988 = JCM 15093 TaxID=1121097 RepID=A0A069D5Q7_9BACE|nr:ABC transporter permease [Bacteroides graminisolvens]GAK37665.1 ABC-type multidrug transport system, permease component [Bacteroides graminisolvens DSM 19988 = JCM 15093]
MLKFLIEKEFKQLLRNSFLPRLIIGYPCMVMIIMPWATNMEIKNISVNVVDNDHSVVSQRLIHKIDASSYFRLNNLSPTYNSALRDIESGDADVILEIPRHFEKKLENGEASHVLLAANAVDGSIGGLASSYMTATLADYNAQLHVENPSSGIVQEAASSVQPSVSVSEKNLYNPHLNYKLFMVPALMVMLVTVICGFLPALNIVSEKEVGTIEQMNVTPVGKFKFILAKLIPFWVVGFVVLTLSFGFAWLIYGILPVGSLGIIYLLSALFVLVMSGFGLVISNHSATMQQAMFVMFFFIIILLLMSGLFTPVMSMPQWAQIITILNPLKYFVDIMRMVYLKGSGLTDLSLQIGALLAFATLFNFWAVKSYRKSA